MTITTEGQGSVSHTERSIETTCDDDSFWPENYCRDCDYPCSCCHGRGTEYRVTATPAKGWHVARIEYSYTRTAHGSSETVTGTIQRGSGTYIFQEYEYLCRYGYCSDYDVLGNCTDFEWCTDSYQTEADQNYNLKYVFEPNSVYVETIPMSSAGETTGDGEYKFGDSCTVEAITKAPGYYFTKWVKDGQLVSRDKRYTFTIDEDRVILYLYAYFRNATGLIIRESGRDSEKIIRSISGMIVRDGDPDV